LICSTPDVRSARHIRDAPSEHVVGDAAPKLASGSAPSAPELALIGGGGVHIESLTLTNFRCFGPVPVRIDLDAGLTAFIGANGSGKSAALEGLLRMFGVSQEQRQIRAEDFHVPVSEDETPDTRELSLEVVITFPELDDEDDDAEAVPEFFRQMAADDNGALKCRFRIEASWTADGSVDGAVTESRRIIETFDPEYTDEQWKPLRPADRARVQMIYVPASRDGARQVTTFLKGRMWRAAIWSLALQNKIGAAAADLTKDFRAEPVVNSVERALTDRWQELHQADTDANPSFRPVDRDFSQFVGKADLMFEPTVTGHDRRADQLSDGQRSLLHIALTAATLDIEGGIADGSMGDKFNVEKARPPTLTILALEEPENSLSPFFLSRIILQMLDIASSGRAQGLISSHSASVLGRVDPERVRHFRLETSTLTARVNRITLPGDADADATYVREAVRAYPELYFARFVVLGEGSSEEVALPILANARGLIIDRSFVAVVPLGGRHVNHFWRLLTDLEIPHATLVDLDRGRNGGGEGRLKTICQQLIAIGVDPFGGIDGYDSIDDIDAFPDDHQFTLWTEAMQAHNVFFCSPIDLDMTLLSAFFDDYKVLEGSQTGPENSDARTAVLGASGHPEVYAAGWDETLQWYRYLFLGRSKPSTHLRVLTSIEANRLKSGTPEPLDALIELIEEAIT
jgi:putative ATP-dependent endonuclease of OLD family